MDIESLNAILTLGAGAAVGIIGMWFMYQINLRAIAPLTEAINKLIVTLEGMEGR